MIAESTLIALIRWNSESGVSSKDLGDDREPGVVDQHVEPAVVLANQSLHRAPVRFVGDVVL